MKTYEDFVNAATSSGLMDRFTPEDLEAARQNPDYGMSMLRFYGDSANAQTPVQRYIATAAARQMQDSMGVARNADAATGQETATSEAPAETTAAAPAEGSIRDSAEYKTALGVVSNPHSFNYDYAQDPAWQAYAKEYNREGQRATANALAQASAATDGRPSTYAQTVAQEAGNYYAGRLADKIPEIRDSAYQRYVTAYGAMSQEAQREETAKEEQYKAALNQYQVLGYLTPETEAIINAYLRGGPVQVPEGAATQAGAQEQAHTGIPWIDYGRKTSTGNTQVEERYALIKRTEGKEAADAYLNAQIRSNQYTGSLRP